MPADSSPQSGSARPSSNVRWMICGLLFFATTVNYVDRQVLSILKPTLQTEFGWNETDYGWIVFGFQFSYALGHAICRSRHRPYRHALGYTIAVVVWSLASASHSLASGFWSFSTARFAAGCGRGREFSNGHSNRSRLVSAEGKILRDGNIQQRFQRGCHRRRNDRSVLTLHFGWRAAFLVTGGLGLLWVIPWLLWFRKPADHPWISKSELAHIQSGGPPEATTKVPVGEILKYGAARAFIIGKFMTDGVWWFYLTWIPGFFNTIYHVNLTNIGLPLIVIYLMADVGSIGGGWLFAGMVSRGWTPNRSRKMAMLICAAMAVPVMYVYYIKSIWPAVVLIGLAAAAHQGWSANLFTMASDAFPRRTVGSVVGIGGLAGAIGGMIVQPAVGKWLDFSGKSYGPIFVIAGSMYLVSLLLIHWMVPNLELLNLGENE